MTAPRQVLPGKTYFVTRRCSQRQYLLKPTAATKAVCRFCLAYASQKYGIQLHAFLFMPSHYHIILTDPGTRLPEFMQWVNEFLARAINCYYGRCENLWAPGSYNAVVLESPEDVIDKMVYTLTNPVVAGLVDCSSKWPGVSSSPGRMGAGGRVVDRPEGFFRSEGPVPETAGLTVVIPPAFRDSSVEGFREFLINKIREVERRTRERFLSEGRRFLGVKGVLRQSPFDRPRGETRRRGLNPRLAGKDVLLRKELIERLKKFEDAYKRARDSFCRGLRDVVFPAGTYKLRVEFGVACEAPP